MKRRGINSHWHPVRNLFSNERFLSRGAVNKKIQIVSSKGKSLIDVIDRSRKKCQSISGSPMFVHFSTTARRHTLAWRNVRAWQSRVTCPLRFRECTLLSLGTLHEEETWPTDRQDLLLETETIRSPPGQY